MLRVIMLGSNRAEASNLGLRGLHRYFVQKALWEGQAGQVGTSRLATEQGWKVNKLEKGLRAPLKLGKYKRSLYGLAFSRADYKSKHMSGTQN